MRKILLAVVLLAFLGILAGTGTATLRLASVPFSGDPGGKGDHPNMPELGAPHDPVPRVVVEEVEFDFGLMDQGSEGSHDFIFQNTGDGPTARPAG